jgi:hypothetical protein
VSQIVAAEMRESANAGGLLPHELPGGDDEEESRFTSADNDMNLLVIPAGLEPATYGLGI